MPLWLRPKTSKCFHNLYYVVFYMLHVVAILDIISRKTVIKDAMKKLLCADDLAAHGKQELQETLETLILYLINDTK